jgi:hypothetical protein
MDVGPTTALNIELLTNRDLMADTMILKCVNASGPPPMAGHTCLCIRQTGNPLVKRLPRPTGKSKRARISQKTFDPQRKVYIVWMVSEDEGHSFVADTLRRGCGIEFELTGCSFNLGSIAPK